MIRDWIIFPWNFDETLYKIVDWNSAYFLQASGIIMHDLHLKNSGGGGQMSTHPNNGILGCFCPVMPISIGGAGGGEGGK